MTSGTERLSGILASLILSAGLVGCGLEGGPVGGGGDGGDGGDTPNRIPSSDPGHDERLDALGIICESSLLLSGTFTPSGLPPEGEEDCWPVGEWRVNTAIDFQGCDPQEPLTEEHVYSITYDEETAQFSVLYENDPETLRVNLKLTFDSSGMCLGGFEHFGEDAVVLDFKPQITIDGVMGGYGTYAVWEEDPY